MAQGGQHHKLSIVKQAVRITAVTSYDDNEQIRQTSTRCFGKVNVLKIICQIVLQQRWPPGGEDQAAILRRQDTVRHYRKKLLMLGSVMLVWFL